MEITDIDIFFFGTPDKDFSTYPKKHRKKAFGLDIVSSDLYKECTYSINNNKSLIGYVEYGLAGMVSIEDVRKGLCFGFWIEIKNYKIKNQGKERVLLFLTDFLEEGIVNGLKIIENKDGVRNYTIHSFEEVSQKLDRVIEIFKENFIADFINYLEPIVEEEDSQIELLLKIDFLPNEELDKNISENIIEQTTITEHRLRKDKKVLSKYFITLLLLIVLLLIFFYFLFSCCNRKVINGWLVGLILMLIVFAYHKAFLGNGKDKTSVENEYYNTGPLFAAIGVVITVIIIFLSPYFMSSGLRGGNISDFLCSSLYEPKLEISIPVNENIKTRYIFCIDKSGSGKNIIKTPKWFNRNTINQVYESLDIEIKNQDMDLLFGMGETTSNLHLMKLKGLKLLSSIKDVNQIELIVFGDDAKIIPFTDDSLTKIASKGNKKKLAEEILNIQAEDETTDFNDLFKTLNKMQIVNKDIYVRNQNSIVIFSDFIHDVEREVIKKDTIENNIKLLLKKDNDFNFYFFENTRLANKSKVLDIRDLFINEAKKKSIKCNTFPNDSYEDIEINSIVLSKKKLQLSFKNSIFDNAYSKVSFISQETITMDVECIFKTKINSDSDQFYYRLNNYKQWTVLSNNSHIYCGSKDELRIKYEGVISKLNPKVSLTISIPKKKINLEVEMIFVHVMPKSRAQFLVLLIYLLTFSEILYIYHIILNNRIKKTFNKQKL